MDEGKTVISEEDSIEGNKINIEAMSKYEAEQRKERRQQMKLACLQMANQAYPDGNGGFAIDPVKVLAAAKEYYKFVRT